MKYKQVLQPSLFLSPSSPSKGGLFVYLLLSMLLSLQIDSIACINSNMNSTLLMQNIVTSTYSTQFDGTNRDIYVSYMALNGNNGVQAPLENSGSLNKDLDYTVMVWVKLTGDDWNKRDQYVFAIPGSFSCFFTQSSQLVCESALKCEKLRVSTVGVQQNVWTHITVSGQASKQSYLSVESRTDMIAFDENEYSILQQPYNQWKVCIGVCELEQGLNGGIREFVFLQSFIHKQRSAYLKNHYLTWDFSILGYYRFSSTSLVNDDFRANKATLVNSKQMQIQYDYISNDICYPFQFAEEYMVFTRDYQLQNQSVGDRWTPSYTDYSYTMSIWIRPSSDHCYSSSPNEAKTQCSIVLLDGVFMLYFDSPTTAKFYFYALQNYYEIASPPIFVPVEQWINIQMTMSQFNGYVIQTYDQQGRLMTNLQFVYNMQEQRPTKKEFALLQNFKGHARSFYLVAKSQSLPVTLSIDAYILNNNFLYYFKFMPKYNGKQLTNYGSNNGVSQDILFKNTPTYEYVRFYDSLMNGKSKQGLLTSTTPLFDGIACNDLMLNLQMVGNNSYVKGSTVATDEVINSATVEFWFRPFDFKSTNYIFQMYSTKLAHEFFGIYKDSNDNLICAPFGIDSVRSPYIIYTAVNDQNIQQYKWFHISCSFTYADQIVGTINRLDLDEVYTETLEENQNYIPKEAMEIYIGNKNTKNAGSPNMFFKDLRVWGEMRSPDQIQQWRYRQLNPFTYSNSILLAYYRLSEVNYHEFNYLSISNTKAQSLATNFNTKYAVDSEISVCPQQTYSFNNTCYNKPLNFILPTVYPMYNSDEEKLQWKFSLKDSSIFQQSLFSELITTWFTYDEVLHQNTIEQLNDIEMVVDETVFADQHIYKIGANITNSESTFIERMDFNFLPINCQWVIVQGFDAFSAYNDYQLPQSTQDIKFQLEVQRKSSGCNTFYNELVPTVTYYISPPPKRMPVFVIDYSDSEIITVTIPKDQQSLMALHTDVKIVMNVFWTHSEYADIMDTSNYLFQNVLYTVNFAYQSMTVIPVLTVNSNFALNGDTITLDGRMTYITTLNGTEKYSNLGFEWQCPQELSILCQGQSGAQLTLLYDQFIQNGGLVKETYQFTLIVTWTTNDGGQLQFYATQSLIWYDIINPSFSLSNSTMVRATNDSTFNIQFMNYDSINSSALSIQWSIVPNVTSSFLSYSDYFLTLTVKSGGFNQNTMYQISATATNKEYSFASHTQTLTYITKYPPFGGIATISPTSGYINQTEFTVQLSNWQSDFQPIKYQLWQSASAQGSTPTTLISSDWMDVNASFTFLAQSSNSFIVKLIDESQEVSYSSPIVVNIVVDNNQTLNVTSLIAKLRKTSNSYTIRYDLMNQLSSAIPSQELSNQQDIVKVVLEEIAIDTSSMDEQSTVSNGNSQIILTNSVQILSSVLNYQNLMTTEQTQQSVVISKKVSKSLNFKKQIIKDSNLMNNYATSLSSLLSVTDTISTNGNRRLQSSVNIYEDVYDQLQDLAITICSSLGVTFSSQTIQTPQFQLTMQRFTQFEFEKEYTFSYKNEEKTNVQLQSDKFLNEMRQISNIDSSSFCSQTLFLLVNPYSEQMTTENISKYSKSIVKFDIVDGSLSSVQPYIDYKTVTKSNFIVYPATYVNNQTICMQYSEIEGIWDSNQCETTLNVQDKQITCYCSMSTNGYYTLAKDSNRHEGPRVYAIQQESQTEEESSGTTIKSSSGYVSQSMAILSIVMTVIGFGTLIPMISYFLDKKDIKYLSDKLEAGVKLHLLMKVVEISKEPLSYWVYKRDQILSYNIGSTTLFSHLMSQMHPFFSILSKFDILEARMVRFSIYFLQFSCFSLISVLSFGPYYRNNDLSRTDSGLDEKDISSIALIGLLGMVMLLPIPCSMKCLNAKLSKKQSFIQTSTTEPSRAQKYEITQEQNILNKCTPMKQNQIDEVVDNDTEMIKQVSKTQQDMIFKPQCSLIKYLLLTISYIVSIVTISLAIIYSQQQKHVFNQYCMIAAFYIGLFGSLFISNIIRILFNLVLAKYQLNNDNLCLRLFISSDALRIVKEIEFVREAEKSLFRSSEPPLLKENKSVINNVSVEDLSQQRCNGNNEGEFNDGNLDRSNQKESAMPTIVQQSFIRKPKHLPPIAGHSSQKGGELSTKSRKPEFIEEGLRKSVIDKVRNSIEKKNKTVKYSCVTEQENSCHRIQQNVPSDLE